MKSVQLKSELIELIKEIDNVEVLEAMYLLLKYFSLSKPNKQIENWEDLPKELQDEINEGLLQADNGDLIDHESVMKKYDKWLSK